MPLSVVFSVPPPGELPGAVWDAHAAPFSNTVAVTAGRLRGKLGDGLLVETVFGAG